MSLVATEVQWRQRGGEGRGKRGIGLSMMTIGFLDGGEVGGAGELVCADHMLSVVVVGWV